MAYRVRLTERAERDLARVFDYVHAAESEAAFRWYEGLEQEILSLKDHPHRCAVTPESNRLRHLLYGKKPRVYRVIYSILENDGIVEILHIRHGARQAIKPRDLR